MCLKFQNKTYILGKCAFLAQLVERALSKRKVRCSIHLEG